MSDHCQVLVVGGGPAGSTAAALLARTGARVRLLEREAFPRYHIGESIIPSCVPVLRLSGALDKVDSHGFQEKRGGVFRWAQDEWIVDWNRIVDPDARSWQVDRADFDEILLRNAAEHGVEVIERATVRELTFDGPRPEAALWTQGGVQRKTNFDFLVDASGRAGLMATRYQRDRRPHTIFQNIAIWGYWRGCRLLPGGPVGAVNVVSAPDGWFWHIPLSGRRYSVGYVTHKIHFGQQRPEYPSLEAFYLDRLRNSESMSWLLQEAEFLPEVRAEQDYSYVSERFSGPGYAIVGDAACFLDPLLATGVHLATYSALIASAAIASSLRGEIPEPEALGFFEHSYRRAYCRLIVLVSRLYQRYEGKESLFWQAQRLVHQSTRHDSGQQSFMDITAGLTDLREAVDRDPQVVTEVLMRAAEQAQDAAAAHRSHGMPGLDMAPMWEVWHHADGEGTSMGGLHLVTSPRLGLQKTT